MKKSIAIASLLIFVSILVAPAAMADAALYKQKCASCHGANGEGKPAMKTKDLGSAEIQKKTDAQLFDDIANGPAGKASHAYKAKGLTDDQIKGLVSFIRTLKK
jgi:mono/diheme cytochrome c family protein